MATPLPIKSPTPGLLDLPHHIIATSCRYLLLQEHGADISWGVRALESVYFPPGDATSSLLSFRATCSYIRDAIDQSFLEFSLNLSTLTSQKTTLEQIAKNTNWKITVLECTLSYSESSLLSKIKENWGLISELFRPKRFVINWMFGMYSFLHIREILDKFLSLNSNVRVQIEMFALCEFLNENTLFPEVDKLLLSFDQNLLISRKSLHGLVKIMPNMEDLKFGARLDERVTNMFLSNLRCAQIVLPNVTHLTINSLDEMSKLSLIEKTFINLKSINICRTSFRDRDSQQIWETLPDSCDTVGIPGRDLNIVQKCKKVRNLYLKDFAWNHLQNLLQVGSELNMLTLGSVQSFMDKRENIATILKRFKHLEYLELIIDVWLKDMLFMAPGLPQYTRFVNHFNNLMLSHKVNLIVIRSKMSPGRLVFAKRNVTGSQLRTYAETCTIFTGNDYIALLPLLTDKDDCCLENIFVGNSAGDYLKMVGVIDR